MATKKTTKNVFLRPVASAAYGLPLQGIREIVSRKTGEINLVLCFEGAEVVMPGSWQIRETEFPDGLYEGQKLNAYWSKDENGIDRFHLEQA